MLLTQPNLDDLRVTYSDVFMSAFQNQPTPLDVLRTEVGSSSASNTYGWIAEQLQMREWLGPRISQSLSEHEYSLRNKRFESTVGVILDDIKDDNLGHYKAVLIPGLGTAAKNHPDILTQQVLQFNSGVGPLCYDGLALFHDSHPDFSGVGGGTFDNKHALALTAENLETVLTAGAAILGENGQPFGVNYTHLIVPRQLQFTAMRILQTTTTTKVIMNAGATDNVAAVSQENVLQNVLKLVVSDRLNNDPTRWYVADLSKPLKPLILQVREGVVFSAMDQLDNPIVFRENKVEYGVTWRGNVGVSLPHLIATSKP